MSSYYPKRKWISWQVVLVWTAMIAVMLALVAPRSNELREVAIQNPNSAVSLAVLRDEVARDNNDFESHLALVRALKNAGQLSEAHGHLTTLQVQSDDASESDLVSVVGFGVWFNELNIVDEAAMQLAQRTLDVGTWQKTAAVVAASGNPKHVGRVLAHPLHQFSLSSAEQSPKARADRKRLAKLAIDYAVQSGDLAYAVDVFEQHVGVTSKSTLSSAVSLALQAGQSGRAAEYVSDAATRASFGSSEQASLHAWAASLSEHARNASLALKHRAWLAVNSGANDDVEAAMYHAVRAHDAETLERVVRAVAVHQQSPGLAIRGASELASLRGKRHALRFLEELPKPLQTSHAVLVERRHLYAAFERHDRVADMWQLEAKHGHLRESDRLNAAYAFVSVNRFGEALSVLSKARPRNATVVRAQLYIASLLEDSGLQHKLLAELQQRGVAQEPELIELALRQRKAYELDASEATMREAVRRFNSPRAHLLLAELALAQGSTDAAHVYLDAFPDANQDSVANERYWELQTWLLESQVEQARGNADSESIRALSRGFDGKLALAVEREPAVDDLASVDKARLALQRWLALADKVDGTPSYRVWRLRDSGDDRAALRFALQSYEGVSGEERDQIEAQIESLSAQRPRQVYGTFRGELIDTASAFGGEAGVKYIAKHVGVSGEVSFAALDADVPAFNPEQTVPGYEVRGSGGAFASGQFGTVYAKLGAMNRESSTVPIASLGWRSAFENRVRAVVDGKLHGLAREVPLQRLLVTQHRIDGVVEAQPLARWLVAVRSGYATFVNNEQKPLGRGIDIEGRSGYVDQRGRLRWATLAEARLAHRHRYSAGIVAPELMNDTASWYGVTALLTRGDVNAAVYTRVRPRFDLSASLGALATAGDNRNVQLGYGISAAMSLNVVRNKILKLRAFAGNTGPNIGRSRVDFGISYVHVFEP